MADVSMSAKVQWTPRGDLGRFVASRVTPAALRAVAASQSLVVEEAKAICPVLTGNLRDSIAAAEPDDTGKAVVGRIVAGASYAGYVEYGTGQRGAASPGAGPYPYSSQHPGQAAQPFMRPALDSARQKIKEEFSSQMTAGLKL